jgi:TPR repeat protein
MYYKGEDVAEDKAEAGKWYRLAAEQGNADAQYNLGIMYDEGEGVPQDRAEAVKWLRLAAEQGHANAQSEMAFEERKMDREKADQGNARAKNNFDAFVKTSFFRRLFQKWRRRSQR